MMGKAIPLLSEAVKTQKFQFAMCQWCGAAYQDDLMECGGSIRCPNCGQAFLERGLSEQDVEKRMEEKGGKLI